MRLTSLALVALGAAQILTACAPSTPQHTDPGLLLITADSKEDADEIQRQFAVRCDDTNNCNPSIALLIMREDDVHIGVCTSSLIAPDTILTNKHCLPSSLQKSGGSCGGLIGFKFPGSNGYAETRADCAQVLAVSQYDVSDKVAAKPQPDYALIKLAAAPGRPTLALDRSGVNDNETLSVVRMSPNIAARQGTISQLSCHSVMNSLVTPLYDSPFSPVVQFNSCPIVHGNSGSPVIGANGIKALMMQGAVDPQQMQNAGLKPIQFGVATNIACLNVPAAGFGATVDPHCSEDLSDHAIDVAQQKLMQAAIQPAVFDSLMEKNLATETPKLPKMFRWENSKPEITAPDAQHPERIQTAVIQPSCYLPVNGKSWLEAYRDPKTKALKTSAAIATSLRLENLEVSVDDENRPIPGLSNDLMTVKYVFSPAKLARDGKADFNIVSVPSGSAITTVTLTPCPN